MQESIFVIFVLLLGLGAWYSFSTLPRQRAFKKHQDFVLSMNVGDEVITYSGIIATITELDQEVGVAKVKLAEGVEVRMLTAAILRPYDPEEMARNMEMALNN